MKTQPVIAKESRHFGRDDCGNLIGIEIATPPVPKGSACRRDRRIAMTGYALGGIGEWLGGRAKGLGGRPHPDRIAMHRSVIKAKAPWPLLGGFGLQRLLSAKSTVCDKYFGAAQEMALIR